MRTIIKFYNINKAIIRNNSGFSLLEMVIAVALSSIILLMVYSAHRSIMTSIHDVTGVAEFYENINLALNRIDKDISYTYKNDDKKNVRLLGENNFGGKNNGKINFVTVLFGDYLISGSPKTSLPRSDIKEVSYFLTEDKKHPELYFLMRREQNNYDDDIENGGSTGVLLLNVEDIKFEFWSGNDWDNKWDTKEKNKYPKAVKTTLTLKNYRGKTEEFTLISYLNNAANPK